MNISTHHRLRLRHMIFIILLSFTLSAFAQENRQLVDIVQVDSAWSNNSVNAVVFRKNSLVTYRYTQFIAFYDAQRYVVLGKRKLQSAQWQLRRTQYQGNAADAHNIISIMVDGAGYLHMAWNHHNNPLHYCRSIIAGSLELTDMMPMTGQLEKAVSYPEFYKMPNGNILFLYRNGASGNGNLVMNQYSIQTKRWTQLQSNLIDGQGQRSAYWQAFLDVKGTFHISWVWRESPDVASNHDLCYARSTDGGKTWQKSTGEIYALPITAASAEYACKISQNSELINQTSMFADATGLPYIATYWRETGSTVPQYHLVYLQDKQWLVRNLGFRHTPFSLSGQGTKRIPISRPQIVAWKTGKLLSAMLIFRDIERGDKVSAALCNDVDKNRWQITDLAQMNVGSWEPVYDTELWKEKRILNLFIQKVEQVDAEGTASQPPEMVKVLEWQPVK